MKRQVPKGFDESGPGWIVKLEEPDTTAQNDDAKSNHCLVFLGGGGGLERDERGSSFLASSQFWEGPLVLVYLKCL